MRDIQIDILPMLFVYMFPNIKKYITCNFNSILMLILCLFCSSYNIHTLNIVASYLEEATRLTFYVNVSIYKHFNNCLRIVEREK